MSSVPRAIMRDGRWTGDGVERVVLAVIGGSASASVQGVEFGCARDCATPWGAPSAMPRECLVGGIPALWLARHGDPHAIAPHRINYRANIRALHDAGATHVLALNTVGGIADAACPGSLWLPDQLVDYTWGREGSFNDGTVLPLAHAEFGEPYDGAMRAAVLEAARACGVAVRDGGVYGCTQGPRLETAAEIRRMHREGCDLVGMTGMPEAALARELGLPFASLALVVNRAAGLSPEAITMDAIVREAAGCMARVSLLLPALARVLGAQVPGGGGVPGTVAGAGSPAGCAGS